MSPKTFILPLLSIIEIATGTLSVSKIDPALLQIWRNEPTAKVNIFVEMSEGNGNILRGIDSLRFSSRTEKISTIKNQLESLTASSQQGLRSILKEKKADYRSFWISNQMFVRSATFELVKQLEIDPEVSLIREEPVYHLPELELLHSNETAQAEDEALWNIHKVEAPQVWSMEGGNKGEGVVVAIIDSGVRSTHDALKENFREEYGWFDPFTGGSTPSDASGHGTHVAGTIVGVGGIGVAPGAKWIACRGCGTNSMCPASTLVYCSQWILCPTDPQGENENCSMAPHISSNSWGLGQGDNWFEEIADAWRSAGIIPIFSIGNAGRQGCETASSPGDMNNVIGVGATDKTDTVSDFSSRGPASSGQVKPDIAAPGSEIWSASYAADDLYVILEGTSMACPHVSGAVALLLSRNSSLTYDDIKALLQNNADRNLGSAEACGNIPPSQFPNNVYGCGRINVRKALQALIGDSDNGHSSAGRERNPQFVFTIKVILSFTLLQICILKFVN